MTVAELPATFEGGPFDGRMMSAELVPWLAFVPRVGGIAPDGAHGPIRSMSREYVESHPHYALSHVQDGVRVFRFQNTGERPS